MEQDGGSNSTASAKVVTSTTNVNSGTSDDIASSEDDEPPIFSPGWRFYSAMSVFMVLTVLESMNSTSTSTALVTISQKIPGSATQYEWIGNAYMLAAGALQLPIASLSDKFGRLPLILASMLLFLAGAISCGAAQNIATLLAGRTIQGIGGAGMLVLPEIFLTDMVPLRKRGLYFALLSAMWSLGSCVGPILGGGFSIGGSKLWRLIFYINVPICTIAIIAAPLLLKLKLAPSSLRSKVAAIDFVGTFLFVASATSIMLALAFGGVSFPWSSWHVLLPLLLGFAGIVAFGFYEKLVPRNPLVAVKVFGNLGACIAFVQVTVEGVLMEGLPYWLPMYFQGLKGYTPLVSGLALLPLGGIIFPGSVISGYVVNKTANYRLVSIVGWALLTLGLGLLLLLDKDTPVGVWVAIMIPTSIGLGILYAIQGVIVQAPNPPEVWIESVAMMSFVRSFGEALGVAIGGSVFSSRMHSLSQPFINQLPDSVDESNVVAVVGFLASTDDAELRREIQHALLLSMRSIFYVFLAFGAFCLVLHGGMKEYSLDLTIEPRQALKFDDCDRGYRREPRSRHFSTSSQSSTSSTDSATDLNPMGVRGGKEISKSVY